MTRNLIVSVILFALSAVAILSVEIWLRWSAELEMKQEYRMLAVRSLSYRTEIRSRDWTGSTNRGRIPNVEDTACLKTTRPIVIGSLGGKSVTARWPAGNVPGCHDFFSTAARDVGDRLFFPDFCVQTLAIGSSPQDRSHNAVVAVVDQMYGHARPELESGTLSNGDIDLIKKQDIPMDNRYNERKFIEAGAMDWVSIDLFAKEPCDGYTLYRYKADITNFASLRENVTVGLK